MPSTFPRTILPADTTMPARAGGVLISQAQSGVINMRRISVPGWRWEETFNFKLDDDGHAFMARVCFLWGYDADTIEIQHQKLLTTLGAGGGTPLVKGVSQTGINIDTDGWPNSTTVLKGGDLVTFASITRVHRVRADCTSDVSGNCSLQLTDAVAAADSPADDAAITVTDSVQFIVRIAVPPSQPKLDAADFIAGYKLVFQEVL